MKLIFNKFKFINNNYYILSLFFILNIILSLFMVPIIDFGDTTEYIRLSKVFIGKDEINLSHRSPLLSMILAILIYLFNYNYAFKILLIFHYILVAFSSYLIYLIFCRLFDKKWLAIMISLLYNFSLSTIYFANIIYTEILSNFLNIIVFYFVILFYEKKSIIYVFLAGFFLGLLALARFSAVPIIFTYFIFIIIILFKNNFLLRDSVKSILYFLIPIFIIVNLWSYYNFKNYGFYGLFPTTGGLPRNAILSLINDDTNVSEKNKDILNIFLEAKNIYVGNLNNIPTKKASFSSLDNYNFLQSLYSGYQIYLFALDSLKKYFSLENTSGEYELSNKLSDFYHEVYKQNKHKLLKLRFYTFLNCLRPSATILPTSYGSINTNILPVFFIYLYKITFTGISVFVLFTFLIFLFKFIKSISSVNFILLMIFLLIISYWFINVVFITVGDANRFKFPAEPFIFGIFVYYFNIIYKTVRKFI